MVAEVMKSGQVQSIRYSVAPGSSFTSESELPVTLKISAFWKQRENNHWKSLAAFTTSQSLCGNEGIAARTPDRRLRSMLGDRIRYNNCVPRAALSHDSPPTVPSGASFSQRLNTPLPGASYFATDERPVVLFDGVCNLCNKWVNFLLDYDPDGKMRFAAIQSRPGEELLAKAGRSFDENWEVGLITKDRAYFGTDAVIQMGYMLKDPFPAVAAAASIVPGPLKDLVYHLVSEHRQQFFGQGDSCRFGGEEFNDRFLH